MPSPKPAPSTPLEQAHARSECNLHSPGSEPVATNVYRRVQIGQSATPGHDKHNDIECKMIVGKGTRDAKLHARIALMNALVVGPNHFHRDTLAAILRGIGFKRTFSIESTKAAREMSEVIKFEFLFLCWQPGARDTEALLEDVRLRNLGGRGDTRTLIVSDEDRVEHVMAMLGYGVDAYIVRPFSRAVIMRHIARLVSHQTKSTIHYL